MTLLSMYRMCHARRTLVLRTAKACPLTSRHLSNSSGASVKEKNGTPYTVIYKFPYINVAYVINRMKRHTTLLSVIALPVCLILNTTLPQAVFVGGAYTFIAAVFFNSIGYFCSNLIGLVYVQEDGKNIKIAYLSTWGKRVNKYIHASEIRDPNDESIRTMDRFYHIIRFHSSDEILKLSVPYGQIVDKKKFQDTFGIYY